MQYSTKTLQNKLRALAIEVPYADSVTIMILVNAGSRYENDSIAGLAHFVEHTIFKGTKKRPNTKIISMEVEMLGAQMNAFTSYDYTGYYIKLPKEKFEQGLEILSDMFLNSKFETKEIDKERGVIIEEKNMYDDQPMHKVSNLFSEKMYKGNGLSRDIIGTKKALNQINRNDFLGFLKKYYTAENIIITVAGGIEKQKVFDNVEKYFKEVEQGKENRAEEFSLYSLKSKVFSMEKDISQSHLILGGFMPGRKAGKKYIYKVADAILGKGFGSKLFQTIRDELGLAYYVYSEVERFYEIGSYHIGLGVENGKRQLAVDSVVGQLEDMKAGNFSEKELIRAKNYILGSLKLDLETTHELASWYSLQLLLEDRILSLAQVQERIENVSFDQIVEVFTELIKPENIMLAAITPFDDPSVTINLKS